MDTSKHSDSSNKARDIRFTQTAEVPIIPLGPADEFIVMATLTAPFFEAASRASIDLVAVIDRSGSMEGEKIRLVQETLRFMIDQLKASDSLALVLYSDQVNTALQLTAMDPKGKEQALAAVEQMTAGGCTNLCAGLLTGIDLIKNREKKNEIASVLLLTDGLANAGLQKTPEIIAAMLGPEKRPPPCSVHSFGYGSDHDSAMLKSISDPPNCEAKGVYFFVQTRDDIADAFSDCLGGLLSVVGQNIAVTVEPLNGVQILRCLTKYPVSKDGNVTTIKLGDIQSEEERDILVCLKLEEGTEQQQELVRWNFSHFNVLDSQQHDYETTTSVTRSPNLPEQKPNFKIDKQKNRLAVASAIVSAKALGNESKFEEGRTVIHQAISTLKNSISANDPFVLLLLKDLENCLNGLRDRTTYATSGGYVMDSYVSAHSQQRSTSATRGYVTQSRSTMRSNFGF